MESKRTETINSTTLVRAKQFYPFGVPLRYITSAKNKGSYIPSAVNIYFGDTTSAWLILAKFQDPTQALQSETGQLLTAIIEKGLKLQLSNVTIIALSEGGSFKDVVLDSTKFSDIKICIIFDSSNQLGRALPSFLSEARVLELADLEQINTNADIKRQAWDAIKHFLEHTT